MDYSAFFCLLLFLMEISFFAHLKNNRGKQLSCFVLLFTQIFLILAFRAPTVLADTEGYYLHFKDANIKSLGVFSIYERFEYGYLFLEQFTKKYISRDFLVFQIIVNAIIIWGTMYFLYKKSRCTWMVMLLYVISRYVLSETIAARQGIAVVIVLWTIPYLENKSLIKYCIGVLLASLFHSSAIIMIVLIVLRVEFLSNKVKLAIIYLVAFVFFFLYSYVINKYLEGVYATTNKVSGINPVGLFAGINALAIMLYAIILRRNCKVTKPPQHDMLLVLSILYVVISIMSVRLWILVRFSMYFFPFLIIYVSDLYSLSKRTPLTQCATYSIIILISFSSMYIFSVRPEWVMLFPYKTYFEI